MRFAGFWRRVLAYLVDILPITFVVAVVFYTFFGFDRTLKGSFGKRVIGIAVTDRNGQRIGIGRALLRNVSKVVSFAPCGLGAIWIAWSREKRAWHDYIAGTFVVLADGEGPVQQAPRE
jgi:uncharacterized RDD family membrane protein YckC